MKIYWHNGSKNIIGVNVRAIRTKQHLTRKELAARLQLLGYDFDILKICRIETGDRFVPDYEVKALAEALKVSYLKLLD